MGKIVINLTYIHNILHGNCHTLGRESREQGARRPGDSIKGNFNKTRRHLITDTGHWAFKHKEIKRGELKQVGSNQNTGGD